MFYRSDIYDGGMRRPSSAGDGCLSNVVAGAMAADANSVITAAILAGGLVVRSGATAARTDTTDTAVNLLAAAGADKMDIGDSFMVHYTNTVAFAITLAGGTGVTAVGNLTVAANGSKILIFTKTAANTMTMRGL